MPVPTHAHPPSLHRAQSRVAALGSRRVPPKAEALRVLRAALYLVGVRHSEMCDPHAPKRLVWERMRQVRRQQQQQQQQGSERKGLSAA